MDNKTYGTGMYGGSFDPPHTGHLNCIISAAAVCKELYVVLSYSRSRDFVPMELRYRWLVNSFRHLENVKVILLEDDAATKEEYDCEEYWLAGRDKVLAEIGKPVDVVFCGSDYRGRGLYERLYNCPAVYFDRGEVPVSSSDIRNSPLKYWDYLIPACRPYFVKKILFLGIESTGKTTLSKNLAMYYGGGYMEEAGRQVCLDAGGENSMIYSDFTEILIRHKAIEYDRLKESRKLLFEDTDALTTLWFTDYLTDEDGEKDKVRALADAIIALNSYDLVFLCDCDVPFIDDGTRNENIAAERDKCNAQLKALLESHGVEYLTLSGTYLQRYEAAKAIIDKTFPDIQLHLS